MVNFPSSLDTDASLFVAVNNKRTSLTAAINASTLTIPVVTTSGFPTSGFITILSDPTDITQAEAIRYTSINTTTFFATTRGAEGTPALPHGAGDDTDLTVIAAHHNELKNAIIELEYFVGVSGSENFLRINDAGQVEQLTAISGSFSQSLTVSGIPIPLTAGMFPRKGTKTFTTATISNFGGVGQFNESFANRALVRKTKVTPVTAGVNNYTIQFFTTDAFDYNDLLLYEATSSGVYVDNLVWFHEDADNTSELHLQITNNSTSYSKFTVELVQEEFA